MRQQSSSSCAPAGPQTLLLLCTAGSYGAQTSAMLGFGVYELLRLAGGLPGLAELTPAQRLGLASSCGIVVGLGAFCHLVHLQKDALLLIVKGCRLLVWFQQQHAALSLACPAAIWRHSRQPVLVVGRQEGDGQGWVGEQRNDFGTSRLHSQVTNHGQRSNWVPCATPTPWYRIRKQRLERELPANPAGLAPHSCTSDPKQVRRQAIGSGGGGLLRYEQHARQPAAGSTDCSVCAHINHLFGGGQPRVDHALVQALAIVACGGGLLQRAGLGRCRGTAKRRAEVKGGGGTARHLRRRGQPAQSYRGRHRAL